MIHITLVVFCETVGFTVFIVKVPVMVQNFTECLSVL